MCSMYQDWYKMKYSEEEFFRRAALAKREISPILMKLLNEDETDGFVMVYYILSRMRQDIIEAMRGMSKDKSWFEQKIVAIDNQIAADPDTVSLRKQIEDLSK